MTKDLDFKITITGSGTNFEKNVTSEIAERIMILAITGKEKSNNNADVNDDYPKETQSEKIDLSIREFLDNNNVKRNPDKITAISYYMKNHEHKDFFKKEEILEMIETAAEKQFGNFARDFKWTLKTGWIAPKKGETDIYYITNTGINAVKSKFSKEFLEKSKLPKTSSKRLKK